MAKCGLMHKHPVSFYPQAFIDAKATPQYRSVTSALQEIARSQGYQSLWLGLAPRAFRLVGATFILNKVRTGIIDVVEDHREPTQAKRG